MEDAKLVAKVQHFYEIILSLEHQFEENLIVKDDVSIAERHEVDAMREIVCKYERIFEEYIFKEE